MVLPGPTGLWRSLAIADALLLLFFAAQGCTSSSFRLVQQGHQACDAGEYALAVRLYSRAIAADSTLADAFAGRGFAYECLGMITEAIEDYSRTLAIDGTRCEVLRRRARARVTYSESLQEEIAKPHVNRALPTEIAAQRILIMKDLNQLLLLCPWDFEGRCTRGTLRMELGDGEGAINDFTVALSLSPRDTWVLNQRGRARHAMKDVPGAIKDFSTALAATDSAGWIHYNRGLVYIDAQRWRDAVEDFTATIRLDSLDGWAHVMRGKAFLSLAETEKACDDFKTAWHLGMQEAFELIGRYCPKER